MRFFLLFLSLTLSFIPALARESLATEETTPPLHIQSAMGLFEKIMPTQLTTELKKALLRLIAGDGAPLARYRPQQHVVEVGSNFDRYRAEYAVLSSNQDKAFRPDFDQYLGVLTALSLANEVTHVMQDKDGSIDDFYAALHKKDYKLACDIYDLQQFASDVVMLQAAYRLERYFLGLGSVKGIHAVSIATEKMGIARNYEQYRRAMDNNDSEGIGFIYIGLHGDRRQLNLSELKFCKSGGLPKVATDIDARIGAAVVIMNVAK